MHLFLFDLYFVFSGSSVYPFSFSSLCKALRNFCFEKCCINKVYPHAITDSVISSHKPKLSQFLSVSVACCVRCYTSKVHFQRKTESTYEWKSTLIFILLYFVFTFTHRKRQVYDYDRAVLSENNIKTVRSDLQYNTHNISDNCS